MIDRLTASANQSAGVRASTASNVTVKNSTAAGGAMGFVAADAMSAVLDVQDSVAAQNQYGIVVGFGACA